ncbi:MAG: hypothetical protein JO286_08060, partial [Solirubrobacterales bacterium]|nr:hypothetical protein [Solirubrobacterales bacterium]
IPGGAGKVLLIAPRSRAGSFAAAARAALENLARTLSVEWARYGATAVAVAPGVRAGITGGTLRGGPLASPGDEEPSQLA